MTKVFILKFILHFFMIFYSAALAQNYNPCKNKLFISLLKKDLDDMSDREYAYFIKKEDECSKYKMKRKRLSKSKKNNNARKNRRKNYSNKILPRETSYIPSIYSSFPIMRLQMTSDYDNVNISGIKLETPILINIGRLSPYLIFEYRNYVFSFDNEEKNKVKGDFGGKAFIGGLKFPFRLFKTRPEFSIMTGKFHFKKGALICLDLPQKLSGNSPLKIKYSIRTNIIQTGNKHGTGWVDFGLFLGYSINKEILSSIKDLF